MKKILLLSAALMAVLAGPAIAQDRGDRGDRGGDRGGRPPAAAPAAPAAAPAPAPSRAAPPANRAQAGRQSMQREQAQRATNPTVDRRAAGRNNNGAPAVNRGNDNRGNVAGRNDYRPGNNGGYRGGARPNYSQYQRAFNAPQRYRYRGSYRQPQGFYYRRWSYGDFLPSLFWSDNYWINDFFDYGLMSPPPGTVWVRYGADALLIDRYTGEVIQVEYSVFF